MSDGDIHGMNTRLQNTVERIEQTDELSEENRHFLLDFKDYLFSQDISQGRIARYLYSWYRMRDHIDFSLEEPEKDDIITLVGKINQDEIKEMAEQTKREYKKAVKKLYSDYLDSKKSDFDGDEFCDFFTLTVSQSYTDPDRLPGPKEVRELVKAADRLRDKAFIMTLWSTGGRIGEVLGLKWKDVKFRNDIATVVFRDTKTGGNREVPVVSGYLYLRDLKVLYEADVIDYEEEGDRKVPVLKHDKVLMKPLV